MSAEFISKGHSSLVSDPSDVAPKSRKDPSLDEIECAGDYEDDESMMAGDTCVECESLIDDEGNCQCDEEGRKC